MRRLSTKHPDTAVFTFSPFGSETLQDGDPTDIAQILPVVNSVGMEGAFPILAILHQLQVVPSNRLF